MAGFITKQEAAYEAAEIMASLDDQTRRNELREYLNGQFRNDGLYDKISSKLRSLAFIWFLGGLVKSVGVNSTQPIMVGIPVLDGYMRANNIKGSGFLAQLKASRDVATNPKIIFSSPEEWDTAKGFTEEEIEFIKESTINGAMAAQHIRFIKGLASNFGKTWNSVFNLLAYPFASMEKFNRVTSGVAMFRIAYANYSKTMSKEAAKEAATKDAIKFIYDVHYPIGKHNLPALASSGDIAGVGLKTAYTFMPFTHNFLLNQFGLLRSAARLAYSNKDLTPEQIKAINKEATNDLITFVHTMALVAMFGGLLGLPFFKDIFDFWEKHFGYSPKQWARETLRNVGGETLETLGMSGLPAVLGANISGSMSIGLPFIGGGIEEAGGVYSGLATKALRAAEAAGRGDVYRVMTNLTPEFLRNPIVALTESDFGKDVLGTRGYATTPQGKISYDSSGKPLSLTGGEVALKAIGFQPTRYAKERDIEQTVKAQVLWATDQKKNIAETYNIDKLENDPNKLKKLVRSVRELNAKITENKIPIPKAKVSIIIKNSKSTKNLQKRRELARREAMG